MEKLTEKELTHWTIPSIVQRVLEQGIDDTSHDHDDEGMVEGLHIKIVARELPIIRVHTIRRHQSSTAHLFN